MDVISDLLSNFGVTWPKFLAQVVLFLIVYWILSKYAFGPIIQMLEERRRRIEQGQSNAEKIKHQLAEAELRYQEILRKANSEAQAIIEEARKSSEAITSRQIQDAVRQAEEIIVKANEAIAIERSKMLSEVKSEMVDLVVNTTAKVTGKVLTPEDQHRLNHETMQQLAS